MKTEVLNADHPSALQHAADVLVHGGVVAFPTDTVYGLGALTSRAESIERLYLIKGRNHTKAIAVLLASIPDLKKVAAKYNRAALQIAEAFWPGPLTLVVPRRPDLPNALSSSNTIGVRIPNHPVTLALLRLTGPLAVTSANLTGQENARTAREVLAQLDGRFHLLIDGGETPGGVPSTVVDVTGKKPVILRAGPIGEKAILDILGA